jgi:hypothetical protein
VPLAEQVLAEMGAEKAGAAGDYAGGHGRMTIPVGRGPKRTRPPVDRLHPNGWPGTTNHDKCRLVRPDARDSSKFVQILSRKHAICDDNRNIRGRTVRPFCSASCGAAKGYPHCGRCEIRVEAR